MNFENAFFNDALKNALALDAPEYCSERHPGWEQLQLTF